MITFAKYRKDVEVNRPGQKGFRTPASKKKAREEARAQVSTIERTFDSSVSTLSRILINMNSRLPKMETIVQARPLQRRSVAVRSRKIVKTSHHSRKLKQRRKKAKR